VKRFQNLIFATICTVIGGSAPARATDGTDCDCAQYKDFEPIRSLSSLVSQAGVHALDRNGSTFDNSAYRLKASSDAMIPAHCRDKIHEWSLPKLVLTARGVIGPSISDVHVQNTGSFFTAQQVVDSFHSGVSANTGRSPHVECL
jgi:hypothetical protein